MFFKMYNFKCAALYLTNLHSKMTRYLPVFEINCRLILQIKVSANIPADVRENFADLQKFA